MRKISLVLGLCSLVFVGCQKEQVKHVYGETYVRSMKDPNVLVTVEKHTEEYYASGIEKEQPVTRGKIDCWYKERGTNQDIQGKMCTLGGNGCTVATNCVGR